MSDISEDEHVHSPEAHPADAVSERAITDSNALFFLLSCFVFCDTPASFFTLVFFNLGAAGGGRGSKSDHRELASRERVLGHGG